MAPQAASDRMQAPWSATVLSWPRPALVLTAILVAAMLWFGTLGARKLTAPDEGRYAEIAREMAASGDWVTPRYNELKYFEKPPLQYWATALAYRAFGPSEWTTRLWTAATGFLGVLLAVYTAGRLVSPAAGIASGLVLAATPLWLVGSRVSSLDMGVSFFLQLAFSAFLLAFRTGATPRARSLWIHGAWVAMALAVLSKGLIGVVLPGIVLGAYVAWTRQWFLLRELRPVTGGALFLAIAAPWFVVVSLRNPEFAPFFFVHEHFDRFVEGNDRLGPWWYFVVLLPLGFLPWLLALPMAQHASACVLANPSRTALRVRLALVLWAVVVLAFFTASRSKLPGYILPAVPPLAMLAGIGLADAGQRACREIAGFAGVTGLVIAVIGIAMLHGAAQDPARAPYAAYAPWIVAGGAAWTVGAVFAWRYARRRSNPDRSMLPALLALALGVHAGTQLLIAGHDALRGSRSAYDLAQTVRPHLDRSQPLYAVQIFDHTLPFYLGKPLTLVDYEDELALGLRMEPWRGVRDLDAFEQRWRRDARPLALMPPQTYEALVDRGVPLAELARDRRRVIAGKPDAHAGALATPVEEVEQTRTPETARSTQP
jgi:4-amino-4-deoxy-L-arabinose transferase-like glycosyltransferase